MGVEEQVRSALREKTDEVPVWSPDLATIRRAARSRSRRRATATGLAAVLAVLAVVTSGLLDALPRLDTAPPADEPPAPGALRFLGEDTAVPPGRYRLEVPGIDPERMWGELDIPAGFRTWDSSLGRESDVTGPVTGSEDHLVGISLWTITGVNPDPCHGDPLSAFQDYEDPGPTVADLAAALRRQPYRVGPPPQQVTLAGYDGLYLQLRFRDGFDPATCSTGHYESWVAVDPRSRGRVERFWYGPGSIDRIWILDVHGTRVVVNAYQDERTSESRLAAIDAMLSSLELHAG